MQIQSEVFHRLFKPYLARFQKWVWGGPEGLEIGGWVGLGLGEQEGLGSKECRPCAPVIT